MADLYIAVNEIEEVAEIADNHAILATSPGGTTVRISKGNLLIDETEHIGDGDIHLPIGGLEHSALLNSGNYSHEGIDSMMDDYAELSAAFRGAQGYLHGMGIMPQGTPTLDLGTGAVSWPLTYIALYFCDYVCTVNAGSGTLSSAYDFIWVALPYSSGQTTTAYISSCPSGWPGKAFDEVNDLRKIVLWARGTSGLLQRGGLC